MCLRCEAVRVVSNLQLYALDLPREPIAWTNAQLANSVVARSVAARSVAARSTDRVQRRMKADASPS